MTARPALRRFQHARMTTGVAARALAIVWAAVWCAPATGQWTPPPPADQTGADWIDGSDFAGVTLPEAPRDANVRIEARSGRAWRSGPANRLMVEGDVRVQVGVFDFQAKRAAAWFERSVRDGQRVWQLAFYFEDARSPLTAPDVSVIAGRLLVTGVVTGDVRLAVDHLEEGALRVDFLAEADSRLRRRLVALAGAQGLAAPREVWPGLPEGPALAEGLETGYYEPPDALPPLDPQAPIFPSDGVVTFYGPDRTLISGQEENAVAITGGVVMQYTQIGGPRRLEVSAERAVVFLDPGGLGDLAEFQSENVRGVYLEGQVIATDGEATIRAPRVYYDLRGDRGVILDAVFQVMGPRGRMPLYVRAEAIRQESLGQWVAEDAVMANVAFVDPFISLGATTITLTREAPQDGGGLLAGDDEAPRSRMIVDAKGVKGRIGSAGVLPLPGYRGEVDEARLPQASIETKNGDPIFRTEWDLFWLLGLEEPEGVRADLLLDGFVDRGVGIGTEVAWEVSDAKGELLAYYIHDDGEDLFSSGAELDPTARNRGLVLAEHRWELTDEWTLSLESSWISDESFVEVFFEDMAETRREFINSAYVRALVDHTAFTGELSGALNDFTPNEFLLQSRGRQVQRLPELGYYRIGDDLLGGAITYTTETTAGALRFAFTEPDARRFGLDTISRAQEGLGLAPGQSPADRLRARGFEEETIGRFDSRHEISAPLQAGPVQIVPFASGRLTAYSDDFSEFREANGFENDDEQVRLRASGGVRASTAVHRINDSVKSELFDLNRMRHIIEPSVTLWSSASTLDSESIPIFDERTEGISEGTAVRAGVRSVWQTKRGGPGRERSVDWLTVRADYVNSSGDARERSPFGRFFESRPEVSTLGEFIEGDARLQLTDAVAIAGGGSYSFDEDELASGSVGMLLDHGYDFSSFVEVRQLGGDIDTTFLDFGASYLLTSKYALAAEVVFDADDSEFQTFEFTLSRDFPQWLFEFGIDLDDVRDDVAVRVRFRPKGLGEDRIRGAFTRERDYPDLDDAGRTSVFGPSD